MDRDELLRRIRSERARLDEVLSRIPDERLAESTGGAWSGRDQLAHLAAWHRVALARVLGRSEGEMFGWPEGSYESLEIDELNERFRERSKDLSLVDARAEFAASYDQLLAAIEGMNPTAVGEPWLEGHPERGTFEQMIAGDTFEHYDEHLPLLNDLAER